ncbi:MAG: NB-ARC domain-containing protein [Candidatus Wallbacteria bacterium]|nr:NB-ARC domain-containing protein [Candidatus Wallbacteria bacterium]
MLPSRSPFFSGREHEISEIMSLLPKKRVILISGQAGVGKTTLALDLAHRLSQEKARFERVLWTRAYRGEGEAEFCTEIIQAIREMSGDKWTGNADKNLLTLAEFIENRMYTVIIDDCQFLPEEIRAGFIESCLLRFRQSRLFMTSSRPNPREYSALLNFQLNCLSRESSLNLLTRMLEKHGFAALSAEQFELLFSYIGGSPLSFKLFLSSLLSGEVTVHSLLSDPDFPLEREQHLMNIIWLKLDLEEREILKQLSLLNHPVTPGDLPLSFEAKESLQKLSEKYLLETRSAEVFFHDLLRPLVISMMDFHELSAITLKLAEHFSSSRTFRPRLLMEACRLFRTLNEHQKSADLLLRLCDGVFMLGNFISGLDTLLDETLKWSDHRRAELLEARAELLMHSKDFKKADEFISKADAGVRKILEARSLQLQSRLNEAVERYESNLNSDNCIRMQFNLLSNLAACHSRLGNITRAAELHALIQAEDLTRIPDIRLARYYSDYAMFLYYRGNFKQALDLTLKIERIYRDKSGSLHGAALFNLALFSVELLDIAHARRYLSQAMEEQKIIGDEQGLAFSRNLLGEIFLLSGKHAEALEEKMTALESAEKNHWTFLTGYMHSQLGELLMRMEDFSQSEIHFKAALFIFQTAGDQLAESWTRFYYSLLRLITGNLQTAHSDLERINKYASEGSHPKLKAFTSYFLAQTYRLSRNSAAARMELLEARKIMGKFPQKARKKFRDEFLWYRKRLPKKRN